MPSPPGHDDPCHCDGKSTATKAARCEDVPPSRPCIAQLNTEQTGCCAGCLCSEGERSAGGGRNERPSRQARVPSEDPHREPSDPCVGGETGDGERHAGQVPW
jgi:hypothetical protein